MSFDFGVPPLRLEFLCQRTWIVFLEVSTAVELILAHIGSHNCVAETILAMHVIFLCSR